MEFGERLKRRRTINDFKQREVPRELLLEAIDVARWAPNHRLSEPWRFHLLGEQSVDAIIDLIVELKTAGKGEATRAAVMKRLDGVPTWLAVSCKRNDDPIREREDYAACCCAIQNMMLYLWQAGIGVKWNTGAAARDERLLNILKLRPGEEFVVGLFYCGYPELVPEQRRKPVSEIVSTLP
jgi:nitroreductase